MKCKECGKRVPQRNNQVSFACQRQGLCRSCYEQESSEEEPQERNLSWSERRYLEQAGFNPEVWSPEFRAEMEDYWEARMKGEC